LNDSTYIDMAGRFAMAMQAHAPNVQQQIQYGYERATFHPASEIIMKALMNLYQTAYNQYKNDPEKTARLVGVKNNGAGTETAALIVVANAMLNLDEVLTKN
jgi:hypothetical protein